MDPSPDPSPAPQQPAADRLLRDFQTLVRRLLEDLPERDGAGPRLVEVLGEHLGTEPHLLAVVGIPAPAHRLVDADIALAEVAGADPDARIVGIAGDARQHMTLGDLVHHGQGMSVGQVDYDRMPLETLLAKSQGTPARTTRGSS